MRISAVRTAVLGTAWRDLLFVVVETDEGLRGVGEVRMMNHTAALVAYLEEAAPRHLLGHDPFAIEALVERMRRGDYARAGEIAMSATAVVELACWDIVGQALGQPVYRLLGGPVRQRIRAYANGWYRVPRTPEAFAQAATAAVARGYDALKFDPFGPGGFELGRAELRTSIGLVEAVRGAVGPDVELLIEMHGRFPPAVAVRVAAELEPFEPGWIEEPVPPENAAAMAKVARQVRIPIATGERIHVRHEFRELLERQAADFLQPDITMFGGIGETRKLAAWADAYYVRVAPHNVGGPVSTAAALHVAASTPNVVIVEHFNDFGEAWVKDAAPGNPEVVDGSFALPQGPGLGVTLDEDFVAEHPARGAHLDLDADDWQLRMATPADPAGGG